MEALYDLAVLVNFSVGMIFSRIFHDNLITMVMQSEEAVLSKRGGIGFLTWQGWIRFYPTTTTKPFSPTPVGVG